MTDTDVRIYAVNGQADRKRRQGLSVIDTERVPAACIRATKPSLEENAGDDVELSVNTSMYSPGTHARADHRYRSCWTGGPPRLFIRLRSIGLGARVETQVKPNKGT